MSDTTQIEVKNSSIQDGYLVLTVERIRVTVDRKSRNTHRSVDITYGQPIGHELKISIPRWDGAGPLPENTLQPIELSDLLAHYLEVQEDAITRGEQNEIGETSF